MTIEDENIRKIANAMDGKSLSTISAKYKIIPFAKLYDMDGESLLDIFCFYFCFYEDYVAMMWVRRTNRDDSDPHVVHVTLLSHSEFLNMTIPDSLKVEFIDAK